MSILRPPQTSSGTKSPQPAADINGNLAEPPELDLELLPFVHGSHRASALVVKRLVDLIAAILLSLIALPIGLVCALLIRLDSRGAVLFLQERVGAEAVRVGRQVRWRSTSFTVYKFRTMDSGADQSVHRTAVEEFASGRGTLSESSDAPYKLTNDPRVTRVGKWLRRTSLDELPQLLNVLKGDMSLVGPRPLPLYEVALYKPWHYERLCAKPGITGLWQIEGRGRTSFDEGTALDITYVRKWSLFLDLNIFLRTIPAVLSRRGAG